MAFTTFTVKPLVAAIATVLMVPLAQAQDNTQETQPTAKKIEVIEVTATHRTENLQEVPLAVTALTGDELRDLNVADLGDLQAHVPNLSLHVGDAQNAVVYMRGVGQVDSISFNDPGVGVYLDDVYLGRVQGAFLDVIDAQQIEVLRGPQGTLYGRNTIGGAVKFTSAKPSEFTEGFAELTLGNYGLKSLKAGISGALVDEILLARVAIAGTQRDGYNDNLYDGEDDYDKDSRALRTSFLYQPNDHFSAYLVLDASENKPSHSRTPHRETPIYSVALGQLRPVIDDPYTVNVNYNDLEQLETSGVALTLTYSNGAHTLKSITSRRAMDYRSHLDLDGSVDASFGIYYFEDQSQVSQELQWLYDGDGFSMVSGLYYFKEDDWSFGGAVAPEFFVPLEGGVMFPFPVMNAGLREQEVTSKAVYTNLTLALNERTNLTLGGRFTDETKWMDNRGEEFAGTGVATAEEMEAAFGTGVGYGQTGFVAEQDWQEFSPKVVVDHKLSEQTMVYASASKGFKSGGFNGRLTSFPQPFEPEELWSYEVGSKSVLADNNVRLNLAAFYNDYTNFQLSRFSINPDNGAFLSLFENAGKATIYGAEMELQAVVSEQLSLSLNAAYLGGGYDELIGDFEQEVSDQRELVNAPKWSGRLGATYWFDVGLPGELSMQAGIGYRSKTYLTVSSSELLAQDAHALVDASLRYVSAGGQWETRLFVKNLTDEAYLEHGFDLSASPGVQLGYYGAPRTFGLSVGYRF